MWNSKVETMGALNVLRKMSAVDVTMESADRPTKPAPRSTVARLLELP